MPGKRSETCLERRAEKCAAQILRLRLGLIKGVTEERIRRDHCPVPHPTFVRRLRVLLRDMECRSHLDALDSLVEIETRAQDGRRNDHAEFSVRRRHLQHSLSRVAGELRDRRREKLEVRVRADRELKARAFKPLATDLEQKGEQVPGKMVTIYVGPQTAVGDRDDRGRSRIRERLSRQYALRRRMSRHEIDELWSGIHAQAPWMHEVVRWLWEQHLLRLGDEDGCFKVPPILICGPPGSGKTHLCRLIGEAAGIRTARIDMSTRTAAFDIAGIEHAWRSSAAGIPVRLLSEIDHANPIIVLDEIDKAGSGTSGGDPVEALLPLLQPETAKAFQCPFVQGPIDLSWINWIATANDVDRVPRPILDRVKRFRIEAPRGDGLRQLVADRLGPVGAGDRAIDTVCAGIESGRMSLRGLGRLAEEFRSIQQRPILQ